MYRVFGIPLGLPSHLETGLVETAAWQVNPFGIPPEQGRARLLLVSSNGALLRVEGSGNPRVTRLPLPGTPYWIPSLLRRPSELHLGPEGNRSFALHLLPILYQLWPGKPPVDGPQKGAYP